MKKMPYLWLAIALATAPCWSEDVAVSVPETRFMGTDTLAPMADPSDDAQDCVKGLTYDNSEFPIERLAPNEAKDYDAIIRFPSPIQTGNEVNDQVSMEWYPARDRSPGVRHPAIIVVHESGSGMVVGRLFAQNPTARQAAHVSDTPATLWTSAYGCPRQG